MCICKGRMLEEGKEKESVGGSLYILDLMLYADVFNLCKLF